MTDAVADLLGEIYDEDGARLWLHSRNRTLGGERPVDLLATGRTAEVVQLLEQLADGNF